MSAPTPTLLHRVFNITGIIAAITIRADELISAECYLSFSGNVERHIGIQINAGIDPRPVAGEW